MLAGLRSCAWLAMHDPQILRCYFANNAWGGRLAPDPSVKFAVVIPQYTAREG